MIMRTRDSNKEKRFRPSDTHYQIGSSDEEPPAQDQDGVDDAAGNDGAFQDDAMDIDDAEDAEEGQDGDFSAAEEAEKIDEESDFLRLSEQDDAYTGGGQVIKTRVKSKRREPPPLKELWEVQPYPTDPAFKWTRAYTGPVRKWTRFADMCMYWYGDHEGFEKVIDRFLAIWARHPFFPPRIVSTESLAFARNPWLSEDFFEKQDVMCARWYERYLASGLQQQRTAPLSTSTALRLYLPQSQSKLVAHLGPHDDQKEYEFEQGKAFPLQSSGSPAADTQDARGDIGGWMLDVGGIVLSMHWAPIGEEDADQLLAVSVIPFSDQAYYEKPEDAPQPATLKQGSIQMWSVARTKHSKDGHVALAAEQPKLVSALCSDWGRVLRMEWCPIPVKVPSKVSTLAFLCSDSKVRVVAIGKPSPTNDDIYEELQDPMATISLDGEYRVGITCFAWVNSNRIAVGHSDGSIALWSVFPCAMLLRHAASPSSLMEISSAFPSYPMIIAVVPLGGLTMIIDLNRPTLETTYYPNIGVTFQPGLLSWSEHLRGWVSAWPSSFPGNHLISFLPLRVFPQPRLVMALDGQPTALAMGTCHPFVLVGASDGSVSVTQVFPKVSFYRTKVYKLKLFQHDFKAYKADKSRGEGDGIAPEPSVRGVCRILHDFKPEENGSGRPWVRKGAEAKGKGKAAARRGAEVMKDELDEMGDFEEASERREGANGGRPARSGMWSGRIVLHDPLTRITALAWNPNARFSWWAAAAMGSGLVRIMDLGTDHHVYGFTSSRRRRVVVVKDGSDGEMEVDVENDEGFEEEEEEEEEEAEGQNEVNGDEEDGEAEVEVDEPREQ